MRVYEKVRAYIDEQGLKQKTIAEKAGIPNVTFNAIMNGKRTLYADDLKAICVRNEENSMYHTGFCNTTVNVSGRTCGFC